MFTDMQQGNSETSGTAAESASNFVLDTTRLSQENFKDDVLIIDRKLTGVDYHLSRCCHPIYGDPVFGFVSVTGGIKIHRLDCPNAPELYRRYGYRIVKAKWSGKGESTYPVTLRLVGNDDIGIINNVTSIINKEDKLLLRAININSHDGLFSGNVTILVDDTAQLEALIKKLRTVKGIRQIERL
jgi:GTP pyrophosphokinase